MSAIKAQAAADAGQPGEFLRQDSTARGAALGGAMAAVVNDASALLWNPAGLAVLAKPEVGATDVILFQDTNYDFVTGAYPTPKWGTFGAAYVAQNSGGFTARQLPTDPGTGFSVGESAVIGGWGKTFGPVSVGAAVKSVRESIDNVAASGAGADAGAIYRHDEHFSIGLMLQNIIQPSVTFISTPQRYARTVDISPAYRWSWGSDWATLAALRLLKVDGESEAVSGGLELQYRGIAAARFGVQDNGVTSGFGLRIGNTSVDYAAMFEDLGLSHLITITQRFGQTREELEDTIRRGISQLTASEGSRLAKAYERRADDELAGDDLASAMHDLESASLLDPTNDEIHERIREAGERWEAELKRQMVERAAEQAEHEQEAGNLLASRSYWRNVLELDPNNDRARQQLARIDSTLSDEDRKRLDAARKAQEEADADQIVVTITALAGRGEWRQAVQEAKKALDEHPGNPTLGKFWPGLQAQFSSYIAGKTSQAEKLAAEGDVAGALRLAEAALHEDPDNATLHRHVSVWRSQLQKSASPENQRKAEQLYYQAVEQYLKGDFAAAGELAKQVMALDPGSEAARTLKDKVDAASRYSQ